MSKVQLKYAEIERPLQQIEVSNGVSGRSMLVEPVLDTPDGFIEFTIIAPAYISSHDNQVAAMKVSPDAVDEIIKGLTKLRRQHGRRAY